ncbi:MAG: hypothetical protein IJ640_00100 [Prevotella sp.]|nr:hypothetical protein [Prevotella sp.]
MKSAAININMRVLFEYDEHRTSIEEAVEHAKDLAVRPIYSSVCEGVHLTDHEISETIIDEKKGGSYGTD